MDAWKCLFKDVNGRFVDFMVFHGADGLEAKRVFLNAYFGRDERQRHGAEVWRSGYRVAILD